MNSRLRSRLSERTSRCRKGALANALQLNWHGAAFGGELKSNFERQTAAGQKPLRPVPGLCRSFECGAHGFWILGNDTQIGPRGRIRTAATLFPVLDRC